MEITKAVFAEIVKDRSGEIDKAELKVAMARASQQASIEPPRDAQVDEVLKALDTERIVIRREKKSDVNEFKV